MAHLQRNCPRVPGQLFSLSTDFCCWRRWPPLAPTAGTPLSTPRSDSERRGRSELSAAELQGEAVWRGYKYLWFYLVPVKNSGAVGEVLQNSLFWMLTLDKEGVSFTE